MVILADAGIADATVPFGRELERVEGQDANCAPEEGQVERLVVPYLRIYVSVAQSDG